tara:strand:- start:486 stop:887 length:402 start_codon:yes stop_codon:yes gene_type:complete
MLTLIEVVFFQELCRCRRRRRRRRSLATRCVCTEYCLLLCVVIIVAVVRIPWMLLPILIIIALKVTEEGQRRALFLSAKCLSVCLPFFLLSFIFRKQKPENVDPKEKPREEKKKKKQREDGGGGAQTTKQQTK